MTDDRLEIQSALLGRCTSGAIGSANLPLEGFGCDLSRPEWTGRLE